MKKHRLVSVLLSLSLVVGLLALPAHGASSSSHFQVDGEGVLKQYTGPGGDVVIPDFVKGIDSKAFYDCGTLTSVVIPDHVRFIAWAAFADCANLESVSIGRGTTLIGDAFSECPSLLEIQVSPENTYYHSENGLLIDSEEHTVIAAANIDHITVPRGITAINSSAFSGRDALTRIDLPSTLTTIGSYAFQHCENLAQIQIPEGVKELSSVAFHDCKNLTRVQLPNSLTTIRRNAFMGCESLTQINIPNGVTEISKELFSGCSSLSEITLPDSVTTIGENAFMDCGSLAQVHLPDTLSAIQRNAFSGCSALTQIQLPQHLEELGHSAFFGSGLTSVTVPGSVEKMGNEVFAKCNDLTYIKFSEGLTTTGDYVCSDNHSLSRVDLPDSLETIGKAAFLGCSKLTAITVPAGVKQIAQLSFFASPTTLYVTPGSFAERFALLYDMAFAVGTAPEPSLSLEIAYPSTQTVDVDGKAVEFQMYALKDEKGNPTNYVKLRDVASVLDGTPVQFNVGWDGAVNIEPGNAYVPNGSEMNTPFSGERSYERPTAVTNIGGEAADLDAIVLTDDQGGGFTYYQLRDLGKALGFNVSWSADKGVFIETDKPYDANS